MKPVSQLFSIVLVLNFAILMSAGCCKSKKVCETAFNLPDLVDENLAATLVGTDSLGDLYETSVDVLNSAENVLCECRQCESVASADQHHHSNYVYYSADSLPPTNYGAPIDSFQTQLNPIASCKAAVVTDVLQFLQDGWYFISSLSDYLDEVEERDEENNGDSLVSGSGKRTNDVTVVRVSRGLIAKEFLGGKPILVRRISSKVTYN